MGPLLQQEYLSYFLLESAYGASGVPIFGSMPFPAGFCSRSSPKWKMAVQRNAY